MNDADSRQRDAAAKRHYRGRFAPSPSGPLHFGSLLAAVGSYLEARSCGGDWLLRIEDVDTPRTVAGATERILHTLDRYGLRWDGEIWFQSRRGDAYAAALAQLQAAGLVYPCGCSRRDIRAVASCGNSGLIYPGSCRNGPLHPRPPALRLLTTDRPIAFDDRLQGRFTQRLESEVGDFVLRRADGVWAYQLAVVVDDAAQAISDVVRGSDLLDSTPRQIYLQQLLDLPTPSYCHLPVVVAADGAKLSKQHGAEALDDDRPLPALLAALKLLGQAPPPALARATVDDVWDWALAHWTRRRVPAARRLCLETD